MLKFCRQILPITEVSGMLYTQLPRKRGY